MSQLSFESLFRQTRLICSRGLPHRPGCCRQLRRVNSSPVCSGKRRKICAVPKCSVTSSPAASELDLARIRSPENIENSRRICARYQPDDLDAMKQLFCLLVEGLAGDIHDFLGALYMEQELGADEMGQYFSVLHLPSDGRTTHARRSGDDKA